MADNRESWGSRFGFIMATAGFAIGLGSVWRFPYMVGSNGGGAFLFVYLIICFAICVPLFLAEMSLGRMTRLNPIQGMQKLAGRKEPLGAHRLAGRARVPGHHVLLPDDPGLDVRLPGQDGLGASSPGSRPSRPRGSTAPLCPIPCRWACTPWPRPSSSASS